MHTYIILVNLSLVFLPLSISISTSIFLLPSSLLVFTFTFTFTLTLTLTLTLVHSFGHSLSSQLITSTQRNSLTLMRPHLSSIIACVYSVSV
jgi:hypothetical protein